MVKVHASVSIEDDLLKKAKDSGMNVSGEVEAALRKRFVTKNVDISIEPLKCEFCKQPGQRETADDVRESIRKATEAKPKGSFLPTAYADQRKLTWLFPDEKWICNKCLLIKIKSVPTVRG